MPDKKLINTDSIISAVKSGGNYVLNLILRKASFVKNTLWCRIGNDGQNPTYGNNLGFGYGELNITMKNTLRDIDYTIKNDTGELYVHSADSNNYHIDDEGYLIYTFR